MPSVGEIPAAKIRGLCEELDRLLKEPVISDAEREVLHATDVDPADRTKDDWWKRLGELRSYARRKEEAVRRGPIRSRRKVDESAILEVIRVEPVEITLPGNIDVLVYPASFDRIMVVEDLYFWVLQLISWREVLKEDPHGIQNPEAMLGRLRDETNHARAQLYAQVCAPGFEPLDLEADPPPWAYQVGTIGELMLVSAWIEVNSNRLRAAERAIEDRFPLMEDKKKKPDRSIGGTLGGFPIMMCSIAFRENKAPKTVMRDRSLAEVFITYTAANRQDRFAREQAKMDADAEGKKGKKGKKGWGH